MRTGVAAAASQEQFPCPCSSHLSQVLEVRAFQILRRAHDDDQEKLPSEFGPGQVPAVQGEKVYWQSGDRRPVVEGRPRGQTRCKWSSVRPRLSIESQSPFTRRYSFTRHGGRSKRSAYGDAALQQQGETEYRNAMSRRHARARVGRRTFFLHEQSHPQKQSGRREDDKNPHESRLGPSPDGHSFRDGPRQEEPEGREPVSAPHLSTSTVTEASNDRWRHGAPRPLVFVYFRTPRRLCAHAR